MPREVSLCNECVKIAIICQRHSHHEMNVKVEDGLSKAQSPRNECLKQQMICQRHNHQEMNV